MPGVENTRGHSDNEHITQSARAAVATVDGESFMAVNRAVRMCGAQL